MYLFLTILCFFLDPEFKDLGELPALPCEYTTNVILLQHNIAALMIYNIYIVDNIVIHINEDDKYI